MMLISGITLTLPVLQPVLAQHQHHQVLQPVQVLPAQHRPQQPVQVQQQHYDR